MTLRDDPIPRNAPLDAEPYTEQDLIRVRQNGRARVMALILGGFALLVFLITIAKLRHGHG